MYREESPTRACKCRTFKDFGNKTSFHGVQYIVRQDGGIFEKLLWTTIILLGAAGSSYMTHQVWMRFASSPIRISIYSTQRPTTTIPFPAITICPAVRLVPDKIDTLLEKLTLPSNISKDMVRGALPSLLAYSQNVPFEQEHLNLLDVVFRFNKYPIEQIFADIEPSCHDLLLKCKWEKDTLPCDQLFKTSLTKDGHCCSFNLFRRKDRNFRPLRTVYFGVQLGLSLIIDPGVSKPQESYTTLSSSGIKLLVHGNYDLPGTFSTEKILANASENLVRISASKLKYSSNVKSLTFEQRKCVISQEKSLKYFSFYRTINCELECKIDRILNHCGCIPYRFQINNKPVCNISNISCVRKYSTIYSFKIQETSGTISNNSKWIYPCDCPPRCSDVMYRIHTTSIPLAQPPNVVSSFYRTNLGEEYLKKLVVHIYLASQFQEEMLRDTVTSIYNVFSSLGGIFGIFLGCSFLSILEIIYYFCYRIFKHHNDHHGW